MIKIRRNKLSISFHFNLGSHRYHIMLWTPRFGNTKVSKSVNGNHTFIKLGIADIQWGSK